MSSSPPLSDSQSNSSGDDVQNEQLISQTETNNDTVVEQKIEQQEQIQSSESKSKSKSESESDDEYDPIGYDKDDEGSKEVENSDSEKDVKHDDVEPQSHSDSDHEPEVKQVFEKEPEIEQESEKEQDVDASSEDEEYDPTATKDELADDPEDFKKQFLQESNEQTDDVEDEIEAEVEAESEREKPEHDDHDIDVTLFNNIVQFFITSSLFNDPEFQNYSPSRKEQVVLNEYNKQFNTKVKIRLNFWATTSYNKPNLRQNEQFQVLVPINPFCLRPDLSQPMTQDELKEYEEFLQRENNSRKWDDYPIGSRLFIGNLAVNTLDKEEVYRIFKSYGEIKQINLKQGYGFVQYATAEQCSRAIEGEKNVPLHNKFLHLEISKHQVQKAVDIKNKRDGTGSGTIENSNKRGRSRSPESRDSNKRSKSPNSNSNSNSISKPEVRVITTIDSSSSFNDKLIKRLKQDGLNIDIIESNSSVNEVPSEMITEAAYNDAISVIITKDESVNLLVYEKTSDGGIRFDEYTDISIQTAIEIILSAKAKVFASQPREFPGSNQSRGRNNRNGVNNNKSNSNRDQGNRNQDGGRRNQSMNQSNNGSNSGSNRGRRDRRGDRSRNQDYMTGSNSIPVGSGNRNGYNNNNDYGYQGQPQYQYPVRQSPSVQQSYMNQQPSYPVLQPHQQAPPPPPVQQQQPNQAQLLQAMQSLDPNALQNMFSLVQQYQGGNQASAPAPAPAPSHAPAPAQGNALSGLLRQLQSTPGQSNGLYQSNQYYQQQAPPIPQPVQQQQQQPPQSVPQQQQQQQQQQNYGSNYSNNNESNNASNSQASRVEQTNDLFETLARLKNNM